MYKKLPLLALILGFCFICIYATDQLDTSQKLPNGYQLLDAVRGQYKTNPMRVKKLIDSGEDPNFTDNSCYFKDRIALSWAISKGYNEEIIKLLVDAGSDVNKALDTIGGYNFYCLSFNILKILIQAGADVNKIFIPQCCTFLSKATYSIEKTEFLLGSGADYNIRTPHQGRNYSTPLMIAIANSSYKVIRLFLEVGCYLDKNDKERLLEYSRLKENCDEYDKIYNQYCYDCEEIAKNLFYDHYGLCLPNDIIDIIGLYFNLKIREVPKKNNLYNINSLEMRALITEIAEFSKNQKLNKEEENYNKCLIM